MSRLALRAFWTGLCGIAMVALFACVPTMMSSAMDRGYEIMKLLVAAPLAFIAAGAGFAARSGRAQGAFDPVLRVAGLALALLAVVAVLATAASDAPVIALLGGYFRLEGLLAWAVYFAVVVAVFAWTTETERPQDVIDAMLMGSVVPACYAMQQRLGLDFLVIANQDPGRAIGTHSNPVQLAEYLSVLMPIAAARAWIARGRLRQAAIWMAVFLIQAVGLWTTQTRGPLIALLLAMTILGILAAAHKRRRSAIILTAGGLVFVIALVVLINMVDAVGNRARQMSYVGRLVLGGIGENGSGASLATRSVRARLGIWDAGLEAFAEAPAWRQLLGFGPEVAHVHYYPHIPASVVRAEDYRRTAIFDRLHSDPLDITLAFGLFGWITYTLFFSAVVYAAAQRLFGLNGRGPPLCFAVLVLGGAMLGALLARAVGLPSASFPALGLGVCLGWMAFLSAHAWRIANRVHGAEDIPRDRWILVAGLIASLLTFWIDAQVSIPLLTSRLASFACAAIVLAVCKKTAGNDLKGIRVPSFATIPRATFLFGILAAAASFLPAFGVGSSVWSISSAPLRILPVLPFCLIATWWIAVTTPKSLESGLRPGIAWVVAPLLIFVSLYFTFRIAVDSSFGPDQVHGIARLCVLGPSLILAVCVAWSWNMASDMSAGPETRVPGRAWSAIPVFWALALAACGSGWNTIVADVAASSARWSVVRDAGTREALTRLAIHALPHEWHYRRDLVYFLLGRAMSILQTRALDNESYAQLARDLNAAEREARDSLAPLLHDPWRLVTLANVLQARALGVLRAYDPAESERAAISAGQLFDEAHRLFPAQPAILRNWAQLKFDAGFPVDGFRLLDLMEELIPNEPEPYIERILMARRVGNTGQESSAIMRAERALDPGPMEAVNVVVNSQQGRSQGDSKR